MAEYNNYYDSRSFRVPSPYFFGIKNIYAQSKKSGNQEIQNKL